MKPSKATTANKGGGIRDPVHTLAALNSQVKTLVAESGAVARRAVASAEYGRDFDGLDTYNECIAIVDDRNSCYAEDAARKKADAVTCGGKQYGWLVLFG